MTTWGMPLNTTLLRQQQLLRQPVIGRQINFGVQWRYLQISRGINPKALYQTKIVFLGPEQRRVKTIISTLRYRRLLRRELYSKQPWGGCRRRRNPGIFTRHRSFLWRTKRRISQKWGSSNSGRFRKSAHSPLSMLSPSLPRRKR